MILKELLVFRDIVLLIAPIRLQY